MRTNISYYTFSVTFRREKESPERSRACAHARHCCCFRTRVSLTTKALTTPAPRCDVPLLVVYMLGCVRVHCRTRESTHLAPRDLPVAPAAIRASSIPLDSGSSSGGRIIRLLLLKLRWVVRACAPRTLRGARRDLEPHRSRPHTIGECAHVRFHSRRTAVTTTARAHTNIHTTAITTTVAPHHRTHARAPSYSLMTCETPLIRFVVCVCVSFPPSTRHRRGAFSTCSRST